MIIEKFEDYIEQIGQAGRLICIDYGKKQTGVAVSDQGRSIASPLLTFKNTYFSADIIRIQEILAKEKASGLVVGLPLQLNGQEGEACLYVRDFLKFFTKRCELPVFLEDERFSTVAVTKMLDNTAMTRKRKAEIDDKLAASYILQTVLDRINIIKSKNH